jgi:hypothetical protein
MDSESPQAGNRRESLGEPTEHLGALSRRSEILRAQKRDETIPAQIK